MIFKYCAYALEVVFFVFLIFDIFRVRGKEGRCRRNSELSLFLPACLSLFLILTDAFFSTVSLTMPAIDILCSLLLMLFLRLYAVSGRKQLLAFSIFLILLCLTSGTVRLAGVLAEPDACVYDTFLFYPLVPLSFMMLYVFVSVGAFFKEGHSHFMEIKRLEELPVQMLIISFFFFILFFSSWEMPLETVGRQIFSSGLSVLAVILYYFRYNSYTKQPFPVYNMEKSFPAPFPSEISIVEQNQKNILLQELYGRILDLFENEKPYLNDGVTISDIAKMLYSNKVYVSRAINDSTGKNFCQFVNHYRITYAVNLFKENPYLKIGDLSDMSGFHSQVSFNMAFRLVMGEVPGEWCKKMRVEMNGRHKKS